MVGLTFQQASMLAFCRRVFVALTPHPVGDLASGVKELCSTSHTLFISPDLYPLMSSVGG